MNRSGAWFVKKIAFTAQARADIRRLDIPTAMRLFAALQRFAETGAGDARKLQGVLHRSEAYR
jgi:hypothetical protein